MLIILYFYKDYNSTINWQDLHVNKFSSGGGGVESVLTEEELGGPLSLWELIKSNQIMYFSWNTDKVTAAHTEII
jgi:hypothetical protein